jgi:hypothetical protein
MNQAPFLVHRTPLRPLSREPVQEPTTLLEGKPYTPARDTNVSDTWRRFGWVPPSTNRGGRHG